MVVRDDDDGRFVLWQRRVYSAGTRGSCVFLKKMSYLTILNFNFLSVEKAENFSK
jgi:hypothetical protein